MQTNFSRYHLSGNLYLFALQKMSTDLPVSQLVWPGMSCR